MGNTAPPRLLCVTISLGVVAAAGFAGWKIGEPEGAGETLSKPLGGVEKRRAHTRIGGEERENGIPPDKIIDHYLTLDPTGTNFLAQLEAWKVIGNYSAEQCELALASLAGQPSWVMEGPLPAMLYNRWAEVDPKAAMDHAQGSESRRYHESMVMWVWMKNDPDAVHRWAEQNKDKAEDLGVSMYMAPILCSDGAESALERAGKLGTPYLISVAAELGRRAGNDEVARQHLVKLLEALPEQPRLLGLASAARMWGQTDPVAAMENLGSLEIRNERSQQYVRQQILQAWADRDPRTAMSWMREHPDQAPMADQIAMFGRWSDSRSAEAGAWLKDSPNSGQLAAGLVKRAYDMLSNQGMTADWSERSADKRRNDFRRNFGLWAAEDPAAASGWRKTMDPGIVELLTGGEP